MKSGYLVGGVFLALLAATVFGDELPYVRIAGIIGPADGMMALIELPTGKYRVVRKGDSLGDGEVLEIAPQWLRVRFPAGERVLRLSTTGEGSAAGPGVSNREISPEVLQQLEQLASTQAPADKRGGNLAAGSQPLAEDGSEEFTARLNAIIQLPEGARITAVDDKQVTSPETALRYLVSGLKKGEIPHLFLAGTPGLDEVYLMLGEADD